MLCSILFGVWNKKFDEKFDNSLLLVVLMMVMIQVSKETLQEGNILYWNCILNELKLLLVW